MKSVEIHEAVRRIPDLSETEAHKIANMLERIDKLATKDDLKIVKVILSLLKMILSTLKTRWRLKMNLKLRYPVCERKWQAKMALSAWKTRWTRWQAKKTLHLWKKV